MDCWSGYGYYIPQLLRPEESNSLKDSNNIMLKFGIQHAVLSITQTNLKIYHKNITSAVMHACIYGPESLCQSFWVGRRCNNT